MQFKAALARRIKQIKSELGVISSLFARKKTLSFITLSLLLIAIPLTVIQSLSSQDIRQHADQDFTDSGATDCLTLGGNNATCNSSSSCGSGTGTLALSCTSQGRNFGRCCHETESQFGSCYVNCMGTWAVGPSKEEYQKDPAKYNNICRTQTCAKYLQSPVECYNTCVQEQDADDFNYPNGANRAECSTACNYKPSCASVGGRCRYNGGSVGGCQENETAQLDFSCTSSSETCCAVKPDTPPSPSTSIQIGSKPLVDGVEGDAYLRDMPGGKPLTVNGSSPLLVPNCTVAEVTLGPLSDGSSSTRWWKVAVTVNGKNYTGFMSETILNNKGQCRKTSPAPSEDPSGNGGAAPTSCLQTTSSVNLRAGPSTTTAVVASLNSGIQLAVTGVYKKADGYDWAPVTVKAIGKSGWVRTDFTAACSSSNAGSSCPPGYVQVGSTEGSCAPASSPAANGGSGEGTKPNSGGTTPSAGGASPQASSPITTSAPARQASCSDNPIIPASPNQIWRAYCSNKCVTNSDCKSLPGWPTDPASSQCYQFTNGSYCLQLQYNNIAGLCRDNPVTPPDGLQWKAACGGKECSKNSDCPATPGLENSNWCYGFDDGARCLSLQKAGTTSANTLTPTPTPDSKMLSQSGANPFMSVFIAVKEWFTGLFR